jgi:3-hydroxy-9,10-secoandrosta-1,3,5(10)-triene-9,17-dione monooxygenase reductase component
MRPSELPPRAVSGDTFRHALSHFATGVTVVSGIAGDWPVGITCQSFMSLSLDPPLVAVAPSRASSSWPLMAPAGVIGISILTDQQAEVCGRFAVTGTDKFAGLRWTPGAITGVPLIDGALACLECGIEAIHEAGDHYLVCARVIDVTVSEGQPLLYFRSGTRVLASQDG